MACPFFQMLAHSRRPDLARDFLVVNHGGRQPVGAQATRGEQRDLLVGGGFSGGDAEVVLDRIEQLLRTLEIAGCAHANDAGVLARRLQREEMVEGGDAVGRLRGTRNDMAT